MPAETMSRPGVRRCSGNVLINHPEVHAVVYQPAPGFRRRLELVPVPGHEQKGGDDEFTQRLAVGGYVVAFGVDHLYPHSLHGPADRRRAVASSDDAVGHHRYQNVISRSDKGLVAGPTKR